MLKYRIFTALLLAPPIVAGVWYLPTAFIAVAAAGIFVVALWEWARLMPIEGGFARCLYLATAAAMMTGAWIYGPVKLAVIAGVVGIVAWCAVLALLARLESGAGRGVTLSTVKAAGGLFGVVLAWVLMVALHDSHQGRVWLLLLFAVVWAADVFAYFVGRRFGRRKLAPRISPNKTWAGAWGALAGSGMVMLAAGLLLGRSWLGLVALVFLGMATAAFSIVGDLFESQVKRQAGAKDSSALLPGHGGVFDRLDSLVSAVPVYALGLQWIGA